MLPKWGTPNLTPHPALVVPGSPQWSQLPCRWKGKSGSHQHPQRGQDLPAQCQVGTH